MIPAFNKIEKEATSLPRILVVDDNVELCANLRDILEANGYNVDTAYSGNDAITLSRKKKYEIALVDIVMGDISGHEVVKKISEISPSTEFIFMTGHASMESAIEACKQKNVISYETKPVNMDHILLTIRQVIERQKAEKELRKSEKSLAEAQRIAHLGSWELDLVKNELTWSDEIYRIFGMQPQEFGATYEAFLNTVHPEDRPVVDKAYTDSVKAKSPYKIMHRIIRHDGEIRFVHEKCEHLFDEAGAVVRSIGTVQDITERKMAEEALLNEKDRLEEVTSNANCGLVLVDDQVRITYTNNIAEKWFGPFDSIKGKPCWKVFCIKEPEEKCAGLLVMKTGKTSQSETFMIKVSGEERFFYEIASPVKDSDGRIYEINIVIIDITERMKADEQIKKSLKEKELLLKEIHHRVKNNMAVIYSLLKLQSNKVEDKRYREMFSESMNRVKTMARIHEELYRTSDLTKIVFSDYINDMLDNMYISYGLSPGKLTLKKDIESVCLGVDTAIPCGLIINELVSNSLKYAFPEERTGEISVVLRMNDKNEVELAVRDNGVGMPADLDFEDTDTLGLNVVNALVGQLQGKIELNRESGTEFKVTFRINE